MTPADCSVLTSSFGGCLAGNIEVMNDAAHLSSDCIQPTQTPVTDSCHRLPQTMDFRDVGLYTPGSDAVGRKNSASIYFQITNIEK